MPFVYRKTFKYYQRNINNISLAPTNNGSRQCCQANKILKDIMDWNHRSVVIYKGGHIEREMCEEFNIKCFNVEDGGMQKFNSYRYQNQNKCHMQLFNKSQTQPIKSKASKRYYSKKKKDIV